MKTSFRRAALVAVLLGLCACSQNAPPAYTPATNAPENQIDLIIMGD
jgi:predicted small lipoprotein YifL